MELMKALIANNTDYAFPVLYSAVERELVNAASSSSAASMPMQGVLIPVCSVRGVCVCVFVNFSFPLVVPNLDLPTRPSLCFGCHPTAADRRSHGISLRRTWGGCCWRQRRAPARGSPRNGLSAGLLSLPSTMAKSTLERWVTAVVMDDARGGGDLRAGDLHRRLIEPAPFLPCVVRWCGQWRSSWKSLRRRHRTR